MTALSNKQRRIQDRLRSPQKRQPDSAAIAVAQDVPLMYIEPTMERLRHAEFYTVGSDSTFRVMQSPLAILHYRKALGNHDEQRNGVLFEAGVRYYRHWYGAGLSPVAAMDMDRCGGGEGNPAWATPTSEHAANHRDELRNARGRLGDYLRTWIDAIVIDERNPAEVGRDLTGRLDRQTAAAIAIEVLKAGLTTLADHWGMLGRRS